MYKVMIFIFYSFHSYFKWLYADTSDDGYLVKEESDTSALLKYIPFGKVVVAEIIHGNVLKIVIDNRSINLYFFMLFLILLASMIWLYDDGQRIWTYPL